MTEEDQDILCEKHKCFQHFLFLPKGFRKLCLPGLLSCNHVVNASEQTKATSVLSFSQIIFESLNPFPHNDTFWRLWEKSLLKTLWEKEKLLVRSNFSFSQVFSTRLDNFLPFLSNLKLSSANSFSLEWSKICRLVMG